MQLSLKSNFWAEARLPCSSASLIILSFSLHVKDHNLLPLVHIFTFTTNNTAIILPGTHKMLCLVVPLLDNMLSKGVGN
ncbi:hypothetical protein C0J52_23622 [Blattella germanica]|nr:hypothetical protein C0J52_23622 [Blattella germanica]